MQLKSSDSICACFKKTHLKTVVFGTFDIKIGIFFNSNQMNQNSSHLSTSLFLVLSEIWYIFGIFLFQKRWNSFLEKGFFAEQRLSEIYIDKGFYISLKLVDLCDVLKGKDYEKKSDIAIKVSSRFSLGLYIWLVKWCL